MNLTRMDGRGSEGGLTHSLSPTLYVDLLLPSHTSPTLHPH